MNKTSKVLAASIGGTSAMTLSSELMSLLGIENFREPEHLGTMISRLVPGLSKQAKVIAGWGAHYAMGVVFAVVFVELWESGAIKANVKNAILLGAIAGIIGLLIWKATFKLHPLPPKLKYLDFYLQRIPAHIVFTVFATLSYRATETIGKHN